MSHTGGVIILKSEGESCYVTGVDEERKPKVEVTIRFANEWLLGLIVVLLFVLVIIGAILIERLA